MEDPGLTCFSCFWRALSRENRLRKEARHATVMATVKALASKPTQSLDHTPIEVSMALHRYNQELSGCVVWFEPTSAVRTTAKVIVMMTREKILPRASFLRHLIWTPLSMLKGMDMTAPY